MIRHIHYDFNNGKIIMKLYLNNIVAADKYNNFTKKFKVNSFEVVYAVICYDEVNTDDLWNELLDLFLEIKRHLVESITISVSDSIQPNSELFIILQDFLDFASEYETNPAFLGNPL